MNPCSTSLKPSLKCLEVFSLSSISASGLPTLGSRHGRDCQGYRERLLQRLVAMGRSEEPSYGLIDSQSVKTTSARDARGIDGRKKVKGRKRHIVTDTQGHLLHVEVHAANASDTVEGSEVFEAALLIYPSLQGVCADAGLWKEPSLGSMLTAG
jgi:hypothetical protein